MKRNILKSMLVAALLGVQGLASRFNTNATAPHVVPGAPGGIERRKRGFRTGIKGVANSNNTEFGANLKAHFDRQRFGTAARARKAVAA
jgi:hypothetical protein